MGEGGGSGMSKNPPPSKVQPPRSSLDFSPAFLRVQENPPAPLPRHLLYVLLALLGALSLWVVFGRLDIVATAEGKLVPRSYLKIVQPADNGVVREILVSEGQQVAAGQLLLKLDSSVAEADTRALETDLALRELQLRRIDAELSDGKFLSLPRDRADLFAQAAAQFRANRLAYQDALEQERATHRRVEEELRGAQEIQTKLRKMLPSFQANVERYKSLKKNGFVSEVFLDEREREKIDKEQDLKAQDFTVSSLKMSLAQSERKSAQITSSYRQQLHGEKAQADGQAKKLHEELAKQNYRNKFVELRAPQAGIVKDLATHSLGTVVSPGTILLTIVPLDEELQADVMVKNEDVGFVQPNQEAKIKVVAYPFQKYGMIDGRVARVSADASETSNGRAEESGQDGKNTVNATYRARIGLGSQILGYEGSRLLLVSGMQVVAEVKLGSRTVLEYLLAPVQKAWHEAGRER